jgi:CheY-like chemotaxis protein
MKDDASRRQLYVLVVEDCPDTSMTLAMLVRAWGHRAETASDGHAALRSVGAHPPDVVLLDIGLPGMSGWDVAKALRGMPDCGAATLVAMTGYGQAADLARSRDAGFAWHVVKPGEPRLLQEFLDKARDRLRREPTPSEDGPPGTARWAVGSAPQDALELPE